MNNDCGTYLIRSLIDKFLDGETSVEEEKVLFRYFGSGNAAGELKEYESMFRWYASLSEKKPGGDQVPPYRRIWQWIASAAVLVLIFSAGWFVRDYSYNQKYIEYKGSYIVRDGKKITDLSIVGPEAERLVREYDERIRVAERQAREMDSRISVILPADLDTSDPEISRIVGEDVIKIEI